MILKSLLGSIGATNVAEPNLLTQHVILKGGSICISAQQSTAHLGKYIPGLQVTIHTLADNLLQFPRIDHYPLFTTVRVSKLSLASQSQAYKSRHHVLNPRHKLPNKSCDKNTRDAACFVQYW
ncbi:hypothetical protein ONS95_001153 [Cadophora gregata]|uniref:uncharacterized protein n=1 Tax=Cadophora gregata TaxID=51156 RepID=UPI0026DD14F7|nr:uncharacterized protein ONS95_001153 [Cadophora gregata]KAK0102044.1 hypothetical protein ONS96_006010 [Cadophora gregata f. sp. sojae]KAK0129218.1 hypothetical protein ONS95_001153 [Cadophora gregata]